MALLAVAALVAVPAADVDADPFTNISGEDYVIKTSGDATYNIIFDGKTEDLGGDITSISFTAKLVNGKGDTMSNAVSPSSGDLKNNEYKEIKVTAPKDAGSYTLKVDYTVKVDVKDGDNTEKKELEYHESAIIKDVNPIKLTVNLKAEDDSTLDLSGVGVYFYVDGEKQEKSFTTFTMNTDGTATATYELVADLSGGKHTFWVESADGTDSMIQGLGEKQDFYVGEKSYNAWIALVVVILLIIIIAFIWVYRKPVKNFGKPKARR